VRRGRAAVVVAREAREYWTFFRAETPFLGFGASLAFLSSFGQTFYLSLFVPFLLLEFGLGNTEFGALYAAATLGSALLLPWTGGWMDRVSLARLNLGVVGLIAGSALLLAGSFHLSILVLAILGLRLAGPGLAAYASLTAMARHYPPNQRGKALGISSLGFSIGEAFLPLAGAAAIAVVGWRGSWILVAVLGVGVFLPMLHSILARIEAGSAHSSILRSGVTSGSATPSESETPAHIPTSSLSSVRPVDAPLPSGRRSEGPVREWTRREMLVDPRFWLMLPAVLLPPFWATGIFLYQTSLGDSKGWGITLMASAFTFFAVARTGSSLVGGVLMDRLTPRRIFPFSLIPIGIGMLLVILFSGPWVPFALMACIGITTGFGGNVRMGLWAEIYGTLNLGSMKSLMAALIALSTAGSPILFGLVLDSGTGLDALLWTGVVTFGVSTLLVFGALRHQR